MVSGKTQYSRGPVIRPAGNEDMAAIRGLIRLFPGHLVQRNLPRAPSFFVAHAGGKLVGCCALQVYSKRLAEVRSLAVREQTCCTFFDFDISADRQGIEWRVRWPDEAKELGEALYEGSGPYVRTPDGQGAAALA